MEGETCGGTLPPWEKREMEARRRGVCIACDTCVLCTPRGWEKRFDDSLKLTPRLISDRLADNRCTFTPISFSSRSAIISGSGTGFEGEHRGHKKKSKRSKSKLSTTSIIRLE